MGDFWDRPLLSAVLAAFALWRFVLLTSPTARRLRAAWDLSYADALEAFRRVRSEQLEARKKEFGVQQKETNAASN